MTRIAPTHSTRVRETVELAQRLLTEGSLVTFYDAIAIVHGLIPAKSTPSLLDSLIHLHDSERTTDGARKVVRSFLQASLQRQQEERIRGAQEVGLAENGERIRIPFGSILQIALKERSAKGFRWALTPTPHIHALRNPSTETRPDIANFSVRPKAKGQYQLQWQEQGPQGSKEDVATFEIILIVEPPEETPSKPSN